MWKKITYKNNAFNYEINTYGEIRHINSKKLINQHIKTNGYMFVNLYNMNTKKKEALYVHRLVAYEFIKNKNNLSDVNHKDGIKTNNDVSNLEWVTKSENMKHVFQKGLVKNIPKGSDHYNNKYSEKIIRNICFLLEKKLKCKEISNITGVNIYTIKSIKNKYNWKHISKEYNF